MAAAPGAAAPGAAVSEGPAAVSRRSFRILVAEDEWVNQIVAVRELEDIGYRADAVGGGHEVLAALQREHYDLVLMDCQMPDPDGYETTRRIRQQEADGEGSPGRRMPVIAVTAYAMTGDREKCLAAGARRCAQRRRTAARPQDL